MRVAELDYVPDTADRFGRIADREWAVFLDSGRERMSGGRYDIFSADPYLTLTTEGATTEIRGRDGCRTSDSDPLEILRAELGPAGESDPLLPFCGGAIGYFAYDLGRRFERWDALAADDIGFPDMAVGLYDWAVVVDHEQARSWLVGHGRDDATFSRWDELIEQSGGAGARTHHAPLEVLGDVTPNLDRPAYNRAFDKIKAHIRAGDCYQVNLTQRFSARIAGSGFGAYERLRLTNPAPFSAYMNYPFGQVLSSSPERFLRVRDRVVTTQPIKGTRARGATPAEDELLKAELGASRKDRAENVMIVDLLRNDLGRTCAPGSVRATRLFDVETFANVHHLVSTVEGKLPPDRHALDVVRSCFPGGSITGAPKVRALQIIEECEPQRRGVYCGAIGYIGFDGAMDTNIAIRTLVRQGRHVHAWAGSGIVADSNAELEYQECLDKASGLLEVLDGSRVSAAS